MMGGNGTKLLDITGEVLEADVKERQFQLWTDGSSHVSVSFRESEEADVTTALKDHKAVRVRVKGWGEITPNGKLLRITQVEELSLQPVSDVPIDPAARPIEEIIRRVGGGGSASGMGQAATRPDGQPRPLSLRNTQTMRTVFADSLYWIAIARPRDPWASAARKAKVEIGRRSDHHHGRSAGRIPDGTLGRRPETAPTGREYRPSKLSRIPW